MSKFIFTFRKIKQIKKSYLYLDGPEDAQDYISELYQNGIMQEYTLKYQNDSDGITVYQNTNYILLNFPMPLTCEQSEITYEAGPYIIQKETPIATYNIRSTPDLSISGETPETLKINLGDLLSYDSETGEFFLDINKLNNLNEQINNRLKNRGITVDITNCIIAGNMNAGNMRFEIDFTAVSPDLFTTLAAKPSNAPWWLNLSATNKTSLSLIAARR